MTIVALDTNDNGLAATSGAPCKDAANEDRLRVDFARANPFARKQINRDIHQVTHDRGACQKGGYRAAKSRTQMRWVVY